MEIKVYLRINKIEYIILLFFGFLFVEWYVRVGDWLVVDCLRFFLFLLVIEWSCLGWGGNC